jgi:hypothetical protein
LKKYFETIFHMKLGGKINWKDENNPVNFPTFEEALGVLDLSELRRESLRSFDSTSFVSNNNQVRLTRLYLILAMSKAIADELKRKRGQRLHGLLVQNLISGKLLPNTIFISANYDLLIDFALESQFDYGVEFTGANRFSRQQSVRPDDVKLLKIHGSLNWLQCPTCNNLSGFDYKVILEFIHGTGRLKDYKSYSDQTKCAFCDSILSPVIVPPTFYKDMSNVFLSTIWNKTENALREVDHVIFCGYSCPDADMHIKYLLKRMQTNRKDSRAVRFTLINHHQGKDEKQAKDEEERYKRFFGANVRDTRKSFEDFAQAPQTFY